MITTDKHTLPRDKAMALISKFYAAVLGENELDFKRAQLCTLIHVGEVLLSNSDYWVQVNDAVNTISYDEFKTLEPCK